MVSLRPMTGPLEGEVWKSGEIYVGSALLLSSLSTYTAIETHL